MADLRAKARAFFDTIVQDGRNPYHVLNQTNLQTYADGLSQVMSRGRTATTLAEVRRTIPVSC